jgi:DNA-binding response OmpR family regulator
LLSDLLARLGYKSNAVISGEKGLDFLKSAGSSKQPVDIVIIDISLDDISGLELSKKIKELNDSIYTIVISSWGVNLFQNTLDDAGVDAVLHKPFRLEQLTRVLPDITKNAAGNQ